MVLAVNFDETPQGSISFDETIKVVPPEQAENKAQKIDFVLGENSPGPESIALNLQNGNEEYYRQLLAQQKMIQFEQQKVQMVQDMIATQEGPVTQNEADFIYGLTQADMTELSNSEDILETEYAKKFMRKIAEEDENRLFIEASNEDAEQANRILDTFEAAGTRNEIVHTLLDDVEAQIGSQSTPGSIWESVETVVPFNNIRLNNLVKNAPTTSNLPGTNLEEQYAYLHSLPPEQFSVELKTAYDEIVQRNPYLAKQFLEGVLKYSSTDALWDNSWSVLDAVDVGAIGAGIIRGGKALAGKAAQRTTQPAKVANKRFFDAMRNAVVASIGRKPNVAKVAAQTGNIRAAAITKVVKDLKSTLTGQPLKGTQELADNIPSLINPRIWADETPNLSRNAADQLAVAAERRSEVVAQIVNDVERINRTLDERIAIAARQLYDETISGRFRAIQNSILDIAQLGGRYNIINAEDTVTNTSAIAIRLGKSNGELFASENAARGWATKRLDTKDFNVKQYGNGYFIEVVQDLPEDLEAFRGMPIPLTNKSNNSFVNTVVGIARTPKDVLSKSNSLARQTVTHGTQRLYDLYKDIAEPLTKLKNDAMEEMKQIWTSNRDFVDPKSGERGKFYRNAAEFEEDFYTKFKKVPTQEQYDAYLAYVQLNDLDYLVRSAGWYRDKVRMGIKQIKFDFRYVDKTPDGKGVTTKKVTLDFEGKPVDDIPFFNEQPTTVMFRDDDAGSTVFMNTKFKANEVRKAINDYKAKGYQLIQVADNNLRVPGFGEEKGVGFVMIKAPQIDRLSINSSYRPGGHVSNRYPFYVKQGKIEQGAQGKYYTGDVAIFTAPTEQEMRKRVDAFNRARVAIKNNDVKLASEIAGKELGMDIKDFQALFKKRKNAKGETVEGLSLDVPVVGTRSGQRTSDAIKYEDLYPNDFYNIASNKHNLLTEIDRRFMGERDSSNIPIITEEEDIVAHIDDGDLLDPIETLSKSAYQIVDIQLKRDYTLKSANDWLEEFQDILDVPLAELSRNPIKHLYNPQFKAGATALDKRNANLARSHILRFLGALNREETTFEVLKNKIADMAYETGGRKRLDMVENWLIPVAKDPISVGRTIAFHAKLGLFNWQQVAVQAQSFVNSVAISPRAGTFGATAFFPARVALLNPNSLKNSAKVAAKFGWNEDEFIEMVTELDRSGWNIISGDVAVLDDITNPKIFNGASGKFLDTATVFFKEGERVSRITAYATAYKEWRLANPGKPINRAVRAAILDRADDITVNMSAANNAVWQRGPLAIPAQFFAYQARLTELYLGKRLTKAEKARLFFANSALYGVPVAAGGVVGAWPIYESVKYMLNDNGVDYNEGAVEAFVQGIPAMMLGTLGLEMDVGSRYGSGGISVLRDWAMGEKTVGEIAVGAAGGVIGDMFATGATALGAVGDLIFNDAKTYGSSLEDLINVTKNISSVNNSLKLWYALNTNRWVSKNNITVDEVGAGEALFMAITGASADRISDNYTKLEILNQRKDHYKSVEKEVANAFRRASLEDDPEIRREYMREAWAHATAGGLTPNEFSRALKQVLREMNETQVQSVDRRLQEDYLRRGQ